MTARTRRSYEVGHRPKFLVVADATQECERAVYFAARRASRIGGGLTMVCVIEPGEFQHWLGVGDVMRQEAEEDAARLLEGYADRARAVAGVEPERIIREGKRADEIVRLIEEDEDIAYLVLAAGIGSDGPGPLVSSIAHAAAAFPVPVVIVPGGLKDAEIDAMS
jgi:nucleotide-binding universal stress UspA family protein